MFFQKCQAEKCPNFRTVSARPLWSAGKLPSADSDAVATAPAVTSSAPWITATTAQAQPMQKSMAFRGRLGHHFAGETSPVQSVHIRGS